jgi:hypothetical protein
MKEKSPYRWLTKIPLTAPKSPLFEIMDKAIIANPTKQQFWKYFQINFGENLPNQKGREIQKYAYSLRGGFAKNCKYLP